MIEASRAMKARRERRRTPPTAARRQDAGDDLRQAVHPHARLLRRRHAPARRRRHHADRPGDAARPRRDHRRHRAGALALCRRHHDPHPRPRDAGRARPSRHRAGDQRPHQALASLPGAGRRHDLRGAPRRDPRQTVAWTGDANNVLASWMHAAERFDFRLRVATPPELAPKKWLLDWVKSVGRRASSSAATRRRR